MGLFSNSNKSNEVRPEQVDRLVKLMEGDLRACMRQKPNPQNEALYKAARRNSSDEELRQAAARTIEGRG